MKKNLLVALANKNYLDQAKQLFSSAYFNAGWKGDYMLLSHDIPQDDLEWFRNKGILVKECKPLYQGKVGGQVGVLTTKFYLFTPEFKKWERVIYIDVDVIIRASIDELTKVKGFAAISEIGVFKLSSQFITPKKLDKNQSSIFKQIELNYDLRTKYFNSGVLAFNTKLIEEGTFDKLNQILNKYKDIIVHSDQTVLNLFFYNQWEKLPPIYNVYITGNRNLWNFRVEKIKGIIFHFITAEKPWVIKNHFHREWKDNLVKADKIDLKNIPAGNKLSKQQIINYTKHLHRRYVLFYPYFYIDRKIGKLGLLIKKYSPKLYRVLRLLKGNK